MKLGINGWRLHGQSTGVGRYLYNVIKHWTPETVGDRFTEINLYTPRSIDRNLHPLPENIIERLLPSGSQMLVWENTVLSRTATDDVVFYPSYSIPLARRGKTVVATHDAASQIRPELFSPATRLFYNRLYGWSARHATLVLTSSEAARSDISRVWNVPAEKIKLCYLAPAEIFKPLDSSVAEKLTGEIRKKYTNGAPFFLFVGKLSGRRNVPLMLKAFAEFKSQTSHPHKLVIVGPDDPTFDVSAFGAELGLVGDLVRLGYASDAELNLLYNSAEIFLMPSTYETISLPIMEAQAVGTPVICIDTDGMREITGGTAFYLKRLEISLLAQAITKLAAEPALRSKLSAEGFVNARKFSWQRCASETLQALSDAVISP